MPFMITLNTKIMNVNQSFSRRLKSYLKNKSTTDNSSVVDLQKLQRIVQQIIELEEKIMLLKLQRELDGTSGGI